MTQGDNRNIMAAQIAQSVYNVPKVITRINDPIRADAYRQHGIVTICGTTILSGLIRDYATSDAWALEKDYNQDYLASNA